MRTEGLAQSILVRLVRHAHELGMDPNQVLSRFAAERLLYRLSRTPHVERFVLKGALLLLAWLGETLRPTRDADLLGFGDLSDEGIAATLRDVCSVEVEPDGMTYDAATVKVSAIRPEDPYGGKRVMLEGRIGSARLSVQVDIGIGDAVIPEPEWMDYPGLLGLPGARLRAYRPESVIAEKLHAMITLGSRNSRMRDFFDIDALAKRESFDLALLASSIRSTFDRRRTALPIELPLALTPGFYLASDKVSQWRAFLRKSRLPADASLGDVIGRLSVFFAPVLAAAREERIPASSWTAGGPWQTGPLPRDRKLD